MFTAVDTDWPTMLNKETQQSHTLLMTAASGGQTAIVRQLIAMKADLNQETMNVTTHLIAEWRPSECCCTAGFQNRLDPGIAQLHGSLAQFTCAVHLHRKVVCASIA